MQTKSLLAIANILLAALLIVLGAIARKRGKDALANFLIGTGGGLFGATIVTLISL